MTPELQLLQTYFVNEFDQYAANSLTQLSQKLLEVKVLWDSLKYSFESGGKRFRPFLTSLVVIAYNKPQNYLPFAMATEMIHTYSLIHDDLPCMDNDDFRRGKPTNHKVYGEDIALLAGDALQTQALSLLAFEYASQPKLAVQLIQLLSEKAGALGMIGGQVLDMKSKSDITLAQVELMHRLKTGALIEAAVMGGAAICEANELETKAFAKFAAAIGLAFQIKDDILDADDKDQDFKSYISLIGLEKTKAELQKQVDISNEALKALSHLGIQPLKDLVLYNQNRNA
ncbi:polyprenyl synthetase family protein [Bdellovibrio sp. qaytius]|nr:polyprenyl synthetase family protein [Bdellovibrio sp. qaytius]